MTPVRLLLSLLLLQALVGCGSSDRPDSSESTPGHTATPTPRQTSSDLPPTDDVATGACDSGDSRDCRVWLPEINGVKNCFVGTQVCIDDTWSTCLSDEDAASLLDG